MIFLRFQRPCQNLFNSKRNLILLSLFLLVFPKGGIKLYDIPITWGYLLLGLFALTALLRQSIFTHKNRLRTLLCLLPFQLISLTTMLINGIAYYPMAVAFWVGFFCLPFIFLSLFSRDIDSLDEQIFFNFLRKGILFISIYGILLFILKQTTGYFFGIPLLTLNWGDIGLLELKHIDRGGIFKLISTYNNGNIYGICLLMFLPIYCFLERRIWCKSIVKFALLLSLSRTVWIGLLFHEIFFTWIFSKHRSTVLLLIICIVGLACASIVAICSYYGFPMSFLFDPSFGGRRDSFNAFIQTGLFSLEPFSGIGEVVYAGIVHAFGWIGLLAFLFALIGPLFYQLLFTKLHPIHQCIGIGLCNYLFISLSDGAILLLPTLAFFWFLYSLLYRKQFISILAKEPKN